MCVGFWSLEHPDYALILCTNRDEFLSRPTMAAQFHSFGLSTECDSQQGSVLSGRDLLAGGSWLGINRYGRVALLTNITGPPSKSGSSRGDLVTPFLLSDPASSFDDELMKLNQRDPKFAGFNLLLLSPSPRDSQTLSFDAAFVTNHGAGGAIKSRRLSADERSVAGMSNGVDGQGGNEWPKVQHGIKHLKEYLRTLPADIEGTELANHLFELLTWRPGGVVCENSRTIYMEPVALNGVLSDSYGTRLSTVILIRRDGQVLFIERDIWQMDEYNKPAKSDPPSERVYRFQLSAS